MKTTWKALLGLAVVCSALMVVAANAEEKEKGKEVTLKGEITCSKCGLKETKACGNAIKVKEDDKTVVYYFNDAKGKAPYHKMICTDTKKGSVTGVVSKADGKNIITPKKDGVKFDE